MKLTESDPLFLCQIIRLVGMIHWSNKLFVADDSSSILKIAKIPTVPPGFSPYASCFLMDDTRSQSEVSFLRSTI